MHSVLDIVGIGFGPSNLALAAAISEEKRHNLSALFLEKSPCFVWHKEMLLNEAEMQISFLKDLATLRNPSSPYTFLNYLHEKKRLSSFINLKNFHPSRIEFNDYFSWVAEKLGRYVTYNSCVIDIQTYREEPFELLKISYKNLVTGQTECVVAKNVVIATGGEAFIPDFVEPGKQSERILHNSTYLRKIASLKNDAEYPYQFAVVGCGQSAAEIVYDLYQQFPNASIYSVYRNFGYKPADESQFSNEIFDASFVDLFYSSSPELKQKLLNGYQDTNYAVVDIELIKALYQIKYNESVIGKKRLHFLPFAQIKRLQEQEKSVALTYNLSISPLESHVLQLDAAILATGYRFSNPPALLHSLSSYLINDENDKPKVNRYYKLSTSPSLKAGIYTQGCNEQTHGLNDTLLSLGAIRSQEILQQIFESQKATESSNAPNHHSYINLNQEKNCV